MSVYAHVWAHILMCVLWICLGEIKLFLLLFFLLLQGKGKVKAHSSAYLELHEKNE